LGQTLKIKQLSNLKMRPL